MSQIRPNYSDPRRRYTHQAYDVTYFGGAKETGPSGLRLSGTYQAAIGFTADAGITAAQPLGDLTRGLWSFQVVNHVALSTGTALLRMPAHGGLPQVDLISALALNAVGVTNLTIPIAAPLAIDRPLTITIAAGTASETAVLSLLATPAENGWY